MPSASPLAHYQRALDRLGFVDDQAQRQAVALLETCHQALHAEQKAAGPIVGVYLWGPVGRGKTWLMDQFHASLQVPARRQHFHHFMQWVHRRLFQLNGTANPLQALARELADEVQVLCFDELFVSDIADAIILGGLFQQMFEQGVVLVATSNQPPDQLYAEGYNRERFLPAIAAIERHMQVASVDGGQDHRLHPGQAEPRYWVSESGDSGVLAKAFADLTGEAVQAPSPVTLGRRPLRARAAGETVLWVDFAELCEQPFSALDFIELCDRYRAILIGVLPSLGGTPQEGRIARGTEDAAQKVAAGDRQLPRLARHDDSVRRFIALVDECYDRRVPLYIEAQVPLEELYREGYLSFAFRRTLSRLGEMQLQRFAAPAPDHSR